MKRLHLSIIALLIFGSIVFYFGCKPKNNAGIETNKIIKPEALLLRQKIEGEILGQRISEPYGVTSDISGNVYLVDAGNDRLLKFDRDFQPIKEAGGYGSTDGLLSSPTFIAIENNLNLYISDAGNQRISVFDTRLNYANEYDLTDADDPSKFGHPSGLRINEYGELWVADVDKSLIWIFNNIGAVVRSIGGVESTGGFLLSPAGMIEDNDGRVLVCDEGNSVVKIYDGIGLYLDEFWTDGMDNPSGIAIDGNQNIWVVDSDPAGLHCFDPEGNWLFSYGASGQSGDLNMQEPVDLTITLENLLIVSDRGNNRMLVYMILYP